MRDTQAVTRGRLVLVATVVYLGLALWLHRRVLGDLTGTAIGDGTTDSDVFAWWLNQVPFALGNGANPLLTDFQNHPEGVNAMWNTSVPLLGVLLAPVTLSIGPVAAYNIGLILGFVAAGVALVAALGPYVRSPAARLVAGGLYAFSPFALAHGSVAHLNLVWAVLPPVLLYLVHVLFLRPLTRPWAVGTLVGAVLAAQLVLYTQTVAIGVLMLVLTAAVLALRFPGRARERLPGLVRAGAACVATFAVLAAYPLYLVLAGPVRPRGPIRNVAVAVADPVNTLVPTRLTALHPAPAGLAERLGNHLGEQGGYLGVAVLVLVGLALWRGSTAMRITVAVGALAYLLALGPALRVLDTPTGIALPWRLLVEVPLLEQIEPVRLQVVVALSVAVLVALWIDDAPVGSFHPGVTVGLVVLVVASWLPAGTQPVQPAGAAGYVAVVGAHLGVDDVVEMVPRVTGAFDAGAAPLRWQALTGPTYRITGGYFIGSDLTSPVLVQSRNNGYQRGLAGEPVDPVQALDALRATGTTVVLVVAPFDDPATLDWTRQVTGVPGEQVADAWLFRIGGAAPSPVRN